MRHRFVAPQDDRLDRLIADNTNLSRQKARSLAQRGGIQVDGKPARHPAFKVDKGAVVEVRTAPPTARAPALPERYRDDQVVVVDKPCGLPSQAGPRGGADHVYGIVKARERYAGLHHRLDTPASGLLLLTVDPSANAAVAEALGSGAIERRYLVVVVGDPGEAGRWDQDIDGRSAASAFRRVATGAGMSVLEVRLETGRTHQIRLHAAGAGHPVVGDRKHGGAAGRVWPRLALHAWNLRFPQPRTGEPINISSPVPADLAELFEQAGWTG